MAALRIEVKGGLLNFGAAGEEMDYLMLDSWKAELVLCTVDALDPIFLNGAPIPNALLAPGGNPTQLYLKFGGMVLNGKPVNLNERLEFSGNGTLVPMAYLLTKTYYDPLLKDPLSVR